MERVIATHHSGGHRLDVVELADNDDITVRLLVDGELLPPDLQLDREPTPAAVAAVIEALKGQRPPGRTTVTRSGLRPQEVIALLEALDDRHKAQATYAQVLADFGDVPPFANIIEAEERHIDALTRLMHRYEVPVPSNPWAGKVPQFASVAEACAAGVQAEIDNVALYDRLIAAVQHSDIVEVFQNLKEASQDRHLPAFHRCNERGGPAGGRGRGGGRHRPRGGR